MWLRTKEGGLLNLTNALAVGVREEVVEPERRVVESVEKTRVIPAKMTWQVFVTLDPTKEVVVASFDGEKAEAEALALFEGIAVGLHAETIEGLQSIGGAITEVTPLGSVRPLEETVLRGPHAPEAARGGG